MGSRSHFASAYSPGLTSDNLSKQARQVTTQARRDQLCRPMTDPEMHAEDRSTSKPPTHPCFLNSRRADHQIEWGIASDMSLRHHPSHRRPVSQQVSDGVTPQRTKKGPEHELKALIIFAIVGGRCRVRTCDPCRVKAVLYH